MPLAAPPARCSDAVILIPGIMGSELAEKKTGRILWGAADLGWYARAWTTGSSLALLQPTERELSGVADRIVARRVLRFPAVTPVLRGVEPYTRMLQALRALAVAPAAVAEFPYDWRLSIAFNAQRFADAAAEHLRRWRAHPAGSPEARLVIVAHSMGGLIARYFTGVLGGDARVTVTLGTPLYGSVQAASILNLGRGAPVPLPHGRLRRLVRSMPGLYDLLPSYRCVDEGVRARALTPADVAALGGSPDLAQQASERGKRLLAADPGAVRVVTGVRQPTGQSIKLSGDVVCELAHLCLDGPDGGLLRENRAGDATVCRESAAPPGSEPAYLPQSHGALARTEEAIAHVCAVLTERELGVPLGDQGHGIEVPDVVSAGAAFEMAVTGIDDPAGVQCRITDASSGVAVAHPPLVRRDGVLIARPRLNAPGVYRVEVKSGGSSAVTQLVLAVDPADNVPGQGPDPDGDVPAAQAGGLG